MKIIAAVKNEEEFNKSLQTKNDTIFYLSPDILTLKEITDKAHINNKKLFVHIDLAKGIGKDKSAILFLKKCNVDGIISTRTNIVKIAIECGLLTVQRFFIVDSHSLNTAIETLNMIKPTMFEIMPGIATKAIKKFADNSKTPVIAGGIIETAEDVKNAIENGALTVSTGKEILWNMEI